jgi:hypothetical protein
MRPNVCVHFTGVQHDTCKVGVRYDDVKDTSTRPYRWPCTSRGGSCASFLAPTAEEIAADEAATTAVFARIDTARTAIVAKHGTARGLADTMPCPNACGGTLHYRIARSNGHIHAACSTQGCCAWME